jgi:hypothetical protein
MLLRIAAGRDNDDLRDRDFDMWPIALGACFRC